MKNLFPEWSPEKGFLKNVFLKSAYSKLFLKVFSQESGEMLKGKRI